MTFGLQERQIKFNSKKQPSPPSSVAKQSNLKVQGSAQSKNVLPALLSPFDCRKAETQTRAGLIRYHNRVNAHEMLTLSSQVRF